MAERLEKERVTRQPIMDLAQRLRGGQPRQSQAKAPLGRLQTIAAGFGREPGRQDGQQADEFFGPPSGRGRQLGNLQEDLVQLFETYSANEVPAPRGGNRTPLTR